MADEVIVCRSVMSLSRRLGDVDIPSHVVEIERGFGKREDWLHFPVPLPAVQPNPSLNCDLIT